MTPNGVDAAFSPGAAATRRTYVLFVGAIQGRKDPLAALAAAAQAGLPLVVAGPAKEPSSRASSSAAAPRDAAT